MADRTTILLTGRGLGLVEQALGIGRDLAPATFVFEDIDLVAAERTMEFDSPGVLFELLNQMEGLAVRADHQPARPDRAHMNNLISSLHIDPATLPIFVTNNVYLYLGNDFTNCCVLGFHGAAHVTGLGLGSTHGKGNQGVQTFAYAAYAQPGTWSTSSVPASPDGADGYYIQDIHAISHEISEWADDPFTNNTVNPWLTPTAPQYGCSTLLETGDPVVGIGVLVGANSYFQGAGANADGYWHPEDEALLPWFAREKPNTTSETLQGGTTGRYTFFGDLNPYPGFQQPATGC